MACREGPPLVSTDADGVQWVKEKSFDTSAVLKRTESLGGLTNTVKTDVIATPHGNPSWTPTIICRAIFRTDGIYFISQEGMPFRFPCYYSAQYPS